VTREKTRIWKGGLPGLLGANVRTPAPFEPPHDAPGAPPASAGLPATDSSAPPPGATVRGRTLVARYGISALGAAPGSTKLPGAATRILPIEQLIERGAAVPAQQAATDRHRGTEQAARARIEAEDVPVLAALREARGRLIRRAVIGVLTIVVLALVLARDPQADAHRDPASAARPARSRPAPPAPAAGPRGDTGAEATASITPAADSAPRAASAWAPGAGRRAAGLERAAVDALASGDHAGAIRLYRQLADRQPERRVYAQAVSILQSRATRSGR